MRRLIALDLDEVLFPMIPQMNKYYKSVYRKPAPTFYPKKYNFSSYYNISEYESKKMVEGFYYSEYAHSTKPIKGAQKAIKKLAKENDLVIITGRQDYTQCKAITHHLVNTYFGDAIDDIYFTNSYSLRGEETPKHLLCDALNVDILIDDIPYNCNTCNTESLLFGNYEWNKDNTTLKRILSWNSI